MWLVVGVITKDFCTYTTIILRHRKSLRDHGGGLGIWGNASILGITSSGGWLAGVGGAKG
jgi:hypothetical protein